MNQFSDSAQLSASRFSAQPTGPPLRKLIRSTATRAFLTSEGTWTRDVASAAAFDDLSAAFTAKNKFHLDAVEVYYSFDNQHESPWDFAISL